MSDPPATAPDPPATALGPVATAPDPTGKLVEKACDLDRLQKSVEDAAAVGAGLWLSYLFAFYYIGIAVGAVTHSDLLLENTVKLPLLGVELPLIAFFVLAPIVFIVSHAYTLVHFVMLGAKVGVFDAELNKQLGDAPYAREGLRRQLPSNIFVQFLAGPKDIREGVLGLILKAIAWSSLVLGPVLLLLLIQVQFLPYHLEWVTWVQRFAVFTDVILLLALWPAVLESRSEIAWPQIWRHKVFTLSSLVPIWLAFTTATFPGELIDKWIGPWEIIPQNRVTAWLGQDGWTSIHNLVFHGQVDQINKRRKSYFSDTLVIADFRALEAAKIADPKKLDIVNQTLNLRGLNLKGAVFLDADFRKVDLSEAQLQGASLAGAQLQGANLHGAQLQGATLDWASLQGADLNYAKLQGAKLDSANLQGAALSAAELQGASLKDVKLQGASLKDAKLQGADFKSSTLDGANMGGAEVWRANLDPASATAVSKDGMKDSPISKDEFAELQAITKEKPEGEERKNALKYIEKKYIENLNPDKPGNEASAETFEKRSVAVTSLAEQLKSLACSGEEDAIYIVRGLIANHRIHDTGTARAPGLVKAILGKDCPVSADLTEADKAALNKLAKEAPAPESKQ
jgi:uncharacterized protein YjbI with pentapeptide repeats